MPAAGYRRRRSARASGGADPMSSASDNQGAMKKAQTMFHHGNEAAGKGNVDYAIQMYREACKLVPGHLPFRQMLRGVQRKKYDNDPKKVGGLTKARVSTVRLKYSNSKRKGRWPEVLEGCEDALALNPWDLSATRDEAEAAENLGQPEMVLWLLKSVEAQGGEDLEFMKHLALGYELNHDFQRAIQIWEKVRKLAPNDDEASRKINGLAANATIARSGMGTALKAVDSKIAADSFKPDVEELAELAMAPEQRLLNQIETDPSRVGSFLELADLYRAQGRLEDAQKVLVRGIKANRDDVVLLSAHAEVQISRLHKAKDDLEARIKRYPEDLTVQEKLDQLLVMLNDFEIKEFRRRLAQRPNDQATQLELGKRLVKGNQHDAAIEVFQKLQNSAEYKVSALLMLGQAFETIGDSDLAERKYAQALEALDPSDTTNMLELHYLLGRLAETKGDVRTAKDHYQDVAAYDYGYKDVAKRLRALNQPPPS